MAKRARGTRPGQRRPTQRSARPTSPAPRPATSPAPTPVAPSALDDAAYETIEDPGSGEREAEVVGAGRSTARGRRDTTANGSATATRVAGGGLAVRYAHEYDYVARDLRRIFALMGVLTAALIVIWLVVGATGIIKV